jgi:tetratricopeptide (TPR) repeat protein
MDGGDRGLLRRTGIEAFPGDCEAHSVGILVGRGAWSEGERRARRACAAIEPIDLTHVGLALAEIGEIRWRRGDLAGAEEAFTRAGQLGSSPHPGMALVRLAHGDVRGAATSIAVVLADQTWDCLARARLLPAQVEIAVADGDLETARSAAAELAETATRYVRPALAAAAECAQARVLLAEGELVTAATVVRRGIALWREAGAPYETARARLLLGEALEQQGDRKHALVEFDAARATFESLGAALDLQRATQLLAAT